MLNRWQRPMSAALLLFVLVNCFGPYSAQFPDPRFSKAGNDAGSCECSVEDVLDKDCCSCTVAQVSEATSLYFKDRLQQLVETPLFRVYAPYPEHAGKQLYDMQCSIPGLNELAQELSSLQLGCAIEQCGCSEDQCNTEHWRHQPCFVKCEKDSRALEGSVANLALTTPVDVSGGGPVQYDLLDNPEQFTGYGTLLDDKSARLIWDSLYSDSFCFTSCPEETEAEPRAEKRLVYRVVSGLQASINTHLAMHYGFFKDTGAPATRENWGFARELEFRPWKELFDQRVGQHPDRIRNMHFVFALLSRALYRLAPHLDQALAAGRESCSKCASEHNRTQEILHQLLSPPDHVPSECPAVLRAFDEASLFAPDDVEMRHLKQNVKARFARMGDLMTCVGCDRCKLWGTLQFHATRVALGVLLNETTTDGDSSSTQQFPVPRWSELKPNDLVALVNALAQVGKSIDQVKRWTRVETAREEL
eukprot:TRINITY_DN73050_c0_g1_i1.p1 TRINITY_DN73050_c0_g1~~TRINITY_DN73050_c0_g1_i1.p1  ORF type:complete len:476 (+),score=56.64 TRINITY_DN73050_c0_g1_i1:113-1540(+)